MSGAPARFARSRGNERRHAEIWANRLREQDATVPAAGRTRLRVPFARGAPLIGFDWCARETGTPALA